ncbi:LpxL/LpxP family acyltransferase [Halomonas denitrificans]|nr:hypothetical protein [Halomonas denitrificans]
MVAFPAMKTAVYRALLAALAWLPLPVLRALGELIGTLPVGGRRARVRANLEQAYPELGDTERRALARRNRRAMLVTALECAPLWHRSSTWLASRWRAAEGREAVDAAVADGRGTLLLGGHLGQWEAGILYGTTHWPITYLYKPPDDPALDRALTGYRARFGGEFVATGSAAMRSALRRLRQGGAVGLLFDQLPRGGEFVEAPFFGRPAPTMTLAWRLARRTGCRVVIGHVLRDGRGWQPRFEELQDFAAIDDPVEAATRLNEALERQVRRAPEQYLWRYRRFDPINRPTQRARGA